MVYLEEFKALCLVISVIRTCGDANAAVYIFLPISFVRGATGVRHLARTMPQTIFYLSEIFCRAIIIRNLLALLLLLLGVSMIEKTGSRTTTAGS